MQLSSSTATSNPSLPTKPLPMSLLPPPSPVRSLDGTRHEMLHFILLPKLKRFRYSTCECTYVRLLRPGPRYLRFKCRWIIEWSGLRRFPSHLRGPSRETNLEAPRLQVLDRGEKFSRTLARRLVLGNGDAWTELPSPHVMLAAPGATTCLVDLFRYICDRKARYWVR